MSVSTKGGPVRFISEPQTEAVVRGPRQGFLYRGNRQP
ncbi:hypothetical protein ACFPES_32530 [Paenibacillus sp. GCM10023248]